MPGGGGKNGVRLEASEAVWSREDREGLRQVSDAGVGEEQGHSYGQSASPWAGCSPTSRDVHRPEGGLLSRTLSPGFASAGGPAALGAHILLTPTWCG